MTCKYSFLSWRKINVSYISHFLLLVLFFHCTFLSKAQNTPGENQIDDTAYHRKIITDFFQLQASVKYIYQCTLDPSATKIAWCADGENGQEIFVKSLLNTNDSALRITAASAHQSCNESEPQWLPDGKEIAFLSDAQTPDQLQLFIADASTGALITKQPLTHFDGYVSHLHWSPDGKYLSVLYVEQASREPSPMAAENRAVGVIDSMINRNVQRIALINRATGKTQQVTPAQLYIFEYDWSPDSKSFCYTAAPPPGDDNWYIAKLYTQDLFSNDTTLVYKPKMQIAIPRWSHDGKQIGFIEGLMSDQGGTGGEIFVVDARKTQRQEILRQAENQVLHGFHGNVMEKFYLQNLLVALLQFLH